jgi:hypothetical protein
MQPVTLAEPSVVREPESDLPASSGISELQREWARNFVLCGGNSLKAAILAGYSDKSARVSSYKNAANPKVMAYVQSLCVANLKAHLPMAIGELVRLIADPDTDARAKVQAIFGLMDRAGLSPPKAGPAVAVQVNVNGSQAQALISEVWQAQQRRLSDIGPTMSDSEQPALIEHSAPMEQLDQAGDRGG